MNAKQRRPLFVDGIYALIALAVIAGPLWILTKYLMDNLPWFNSLHSFASQIVGFSILGWVALVIISALIALIRRKEQGEAADWEFVAFNHHYHRHPDDAYVDSNLSSKPKMIRPQMGGHQPQWFK